MARFAQVLPTDATAAGDLARQLARLIGPSIQPGDGTAAAAELLALAGAIATARGNTESAILEGFVDTAQSMLTELEDEYGLPSHPDYSAASRRPPLTARVKAWSASVQRLQAALAILTLATVVINEATPSTVATAVDVFRFGVWIGSDTLMANAILLQQLDDQLDATAPAHTNWQYGDNSSRGFFTDDPGSLTDNTLLAS